MMRLPFMHTTFSAFRVAGVHAFVVIWEALLIVVAGVARPTSIAIPFIPGSFVAPAILFFPVTFVTGVLFSPVTFLTGVMPKSLWVHPHRLCHRSEDVRRSGLWVFFSPAQGRAQPLKGLESCLCGAIHAVGVQLDPGSTQLARETGVLGKKRRRNRKVAHSGFGTLVAVASDHNPDCTRGTLVGLVQP